MYRAEADRADDDYVARRIRDDLSGWASAPGSDWDDLMRRASKIPHPALVLTVSGVVQAAILVVAVITMTSFGLGPLATPPI